MDTRVAPNQPRLVQLFFKGLLKSPTAYRLALTVNVPDRSVYYERGYALEIDHAWVPDMVSPGDEIVLYMFWPDHLESEALVAGKSPLTIKLPGVGRDGQGLFLNQPKYEVGTKFKRHFGTSHPVEMVVDDHRWASDHWTYGMKTGRSSAIHYLTEEQLDVTA